LQGHPPPLLGSSEAGSPPPNFFVKEGNVGRTEARDSFDNTIVVPCDSNECDIII